MKSRNQLEAIGLNIARYGLVVVLLWIGGMKFTALEAKGIMPLVSHSPFMDWVYTVMSVRTFSAVLGVVEIVIGLLIALRSVVPRASMVGSGAAVIMFLTTLSFLLTTPGWAPDIGFPALSVVPGQFVLKDLVLLGVALLTAGEAYESYRGPHREAHREAHSVPNSAPAR